MYPESKVSVRKTALKLITEYGTLEKLYENVDSIKGKTGELLKTGKDMAFLSRGPCHHKTRCSS